MFQFWDNIYNWIHRECKIQLDRLTSQLVKEMNENTELKKQIVDLTETIKSFTIDNSESPDWLDTTKSAYQPYVFVVETSGTLRQLKLIPQDIYAHTKTLEEFVEQRGWRKLKLNDKLREIWKYIVLTLTYRYDYLDDWEFPIETFTKNYGDCEDGTILFLTLAKLAGVPADKIFNACGWYDDGQSKFGHSFPIAQMEDEKWYIFETTLNFLPQNPKPFEGSCYTAEWGVANHRFQGQIKKEYWKNGKPQI